MSKLKEWSEEDVESIVSKYMNGDSAISIAKQFNVSPTPIYKLLKNRNIKIRTISEASRKYSLNEQYFEEINSPNKAYFLGFLFADGYNDEKRNSIEVSCSEKDEELILKLNKEIESNKPIQYFKIKDKKYCRISWCSEKISRDLCNIGCKQAKTFKITYPKIDKLFEKDFIRGYFDGDGCISYSYVKKDNYFGNIFNGVITFVGTELFCLHLKDILLKEIYVNSSILCRHPLNKNNIRTLQISGNNQVRRLADWMYADSDLFLKRKKDKYEKFQFILSDRKNKLKNKK